MLELAKPIDLGIVALCRGSICGFVLGQETYLAERQIQEGEIAIIGVSPDHQVKHVAAKLVYAICDLFQSRGVQEVRIGIDSSDKDLQSFFQRVGFGSQRVIFYQKIL